MASPARILVAGGDPAARAAVAAMLRQDELGVDEAPDVAAHAAGGDEPPDLCLLLGDDVVPACAAARQTPGFETLPIIAMVTRDLAGQAAAAVAAGADDVVVAPPAAGPLAVRVRAGLRAAQDKEHARRGRQC